MYRHHGNLGAFGYSQYRESLNVTISAPEKHLIAPARLAQLPCPPCAQHSDAQTRQGRSQCFAMGQRRLERTRLVQAQRRHI